MKKHVVFCVFFMLTYCLLSQNNERVALVIGNANYSNSVPLRNAVNDANVMEHTLQSLGFKVVKRINANRAEMENGVREFASLLSSATTALFYYAGHGITSGGTNFLIPIDAKLEQEMDLKYEALSVNFVVDEFEQYPDNTNIVILDACRDNPLRTWQGSRGGQRGFKAINPTSGTIIAFATSEGSTAADGIGTNGLYTSVLIEEMKKPIPIESVFKNTRRIVEQKSKNKQSPQEWSKLKGDFYFTRSSNDLNTITEIPINKPTEIYNSNKFQSMVIEEVLLTGTLKILSEVDGDLYFDNENVKSIQSGTVTILKNLKIGSHVIKIRDYEERIEIEKEHTTEISITKFKVENSGAFQDTRDGKKYNVAIIGNQAWMTENMACKTTSGKFYAYDNNENKVVKFGYLYNKEAAKNACPSGWHLPDKNDFIELLKTNDSSSGKLLTEGSSKFNAVLAGYCFFGVFSQEGVSANFWGDGDVFLQITEKKATLMSSGIKECFSVRCIKGN